MVSKRCRILSKELQGLVNLSKGMEHHMKAAYRIKKKMDKHIDRMVLRDMNAERKDDL